MALKYFSLRCPGGARKKREKCNFFSLFLPLSPFRTGVRRIFGVLPLSGILLKSTVAFIRLTRKTREIDIADTAPGGEQSNFTVYLHSFLWIVWNFFLNDHTLRSFSQAIKHFDIVKRIPNVFMIQNLYVNLNFGAVPLFYLGAARLVKAGSGQILH